MKSGLRSKEYSMRLSVGKVVVVEVVYSNGTPTYSNHSDFKSAYPAKPSTAAPVDKTRKCPRSAASLAINLTVEKALRSWMERARVAVTEIASNSTSNPGVLLTLIPSITSKHDFG